MAYVRLVAFVGEALKAAGLADAMVTGTHVDGGPLAGFRY